MGKRGLPVRMTPPQAMSLQLGGGYMVGDIGFWINAGPVMDGLGRRVSGP